MTDNRPFGIDCSKWQGKLKWDLIARHEPKVRFAGIRAAVSWGYTDSWFAMNWAEAKRVNILRTAYHVVYPGEDPQRQMDHFLRVVGNDIGELPLTLDCELSHGQTGAKIIDTILKCAAILETRTKRIPIIYTAAWFVNGYCPGDWLNGFDCWIANYLSVAEEHPGPPILPKKMDPQRLLIHQTADKIPMIVDGVNVSEAKATDRDRWVGDLASLYAYASAEPPQEELSLGNKVDALWKAHPELHG